ncbi:hypothetical protein CISIN_1g0098231mg, partial [Citrus sinensis]
NVDLVCVPVCCRDNVDLVPGFNKHICYL